MNPSPQTRHPLHPYGIALALVVAAAILRVWPLQSMEGLSPWVTFYPAVVIAVVCAGFGSGLLAALLSVLTVLFILPLLLHGKLVQNPADWLELAVFLVTGTALAYVSGVLRGSKENDAGKDANIVKEAKEPPSPEKLNDERARLEFIFNAVPVGISFFSFDAQDQFTHIINDEHLRIMGITREEAHDWRIYQKMTHPDDVERQRAMFREIDVGKIDHFTLDKRYIRPDGEIVWVFFSFRRRNFADGGHEDLSIVMDISERKRAEEGLRRAQEEAARERERLQFIFDSAPVGISLNVIRPDGRDLFILNDRQLRICGITREQANEPDIFKRISDPDDYKKQMALFADIWEGRIKDFSMDKRYLTPDGRTVWVLYSVKRRAYEDGSCDDLTIVVDITERKQMEETLRKSEENLSVTLQSIGDGVMTTDAAGLVTRLNPVAEELTGWKQAAAIGRPVKEIFHIINEETRQPAEVPVDHVLATGEIHGLANHTVLISRDRIERPIADSAAPIRDKDGHILGVVLVFRDVTAERDADRAIRESERRLRMSNESLGQRVQERTAELVAANSELVAEISRRKLAEESLSHLNADLEVRVRERTLALEEANRELEAFSYSVSHDLRAPLRHIQGYVKLLENESGGLISEKGRRFLGTISDSSRDMGDLIDDLLSFSRMSRTEMHESAVSLDDVVKECLQKLEIATQGRAIHWKIAPLPAVMGDLPMLRLVFINLLGNAIKYTQPRNPAEIEIGSAGSEEDRVILFVRDNGVGFDMQYAQKLFGVFQRMHRAEEFEGTGIGLANVRRIIARHGGRVWAEAEINKGATFYFTLKPQQPNGASPDVGQAAVQTM